MAVDPISEGAKAVQEVAKATGKALDLASRASGWIGEAVGRPVAEAIAYYVTDPLQVKRIERAIYDEARLRDLFNELNGVMGEGAMRLRPLPPKVAIPLLESATMEYDDTLLHLWAQLLATAINAEEEPVERQYVSILASLSAADAVALQGLWAESFEPANQEAFNDGPVTYHPSLDASVHGERVTASLSKQGLVAPSMMQLSLYVPAEDHESSWGPQQHRIDVPGDARFVTFTDLGRAFCRAVGMKAPEVTAEAACAA